MMRRPTVELLACSTYPGMSCARHILRKEKAAGLAPYVGGPFVYTRFVGTDELGRSITGDATIRHLDRSF
jgi:hypothetical protein